MKWQSDFLQIMELAVLYLVVIETTVIHKTLQLKLDIPWINPDD